ncbi:MAG: isoamylase early set domain-containing protein [Saprospiraceae bacterium]|jgi:1,4-alpha-glucan branching enzyme|nr:isoamylase early set domain-containing protein [Saprospiraceae bacterium]
MAIDKKLNKTKSQYKVTFELKNELPMTAESVAVCGDFNAWDKSALILKKQKDGSFKGAIELPAGKEFQFRYLINNEIWTNEVDADGLVYNGIVDYNSIIKLDTI